MYNFLLAFTVCGAAVIIGELVSSWTKAWVPSVFVTACLFLLGYWTVLPHDLIKDSYLIPFGGTICVMVMIAPAGEVVIEKGVIAAKRHIHFNVEEAAAAGVEDKQIVSVKVGKEGERSVIFGDVVVRVSPKYAAAMHIDTDESNAAALGGTVEGEIVK